MTDTTYEPVQVHVVNPSPAPKLKQYRTVYYTVTLTAADPVQQILPVSDKRCIARIMAIDVDIIIDDTEGDVQRFSGAYIPCVVPSAGKPNLNVPFPIEDNGVVWVGPAAALTGTNVARVSVAATYEG